MFSYSQPTSIKTFISTLAVWHSSSFFNHLHSVFFLRVFQTHFQAAFSVLSRTSTHTVPSVLPAPTPQLPPAFFNSSVSQLNSLDSFSGGGHGTTTLDTLDDLLTSQGLDALDNFSSGIRGEAGAPDLGLTSAVMDSLDDLDSLDDFLDTAPSAAATDKVNESKTELDAGEKSLDDLLDELDPVEMVSVPVRLGGDVLKIGVKAVDKLDSLDVLDSFPSVQRVGAALPAACTGRTDLDSLSGFSSAGDYDLLYYGQSRRHVFFKDVITGN